MGHILGSMLLVALARIQQKMTMKSLQIACVDNIKQTDERGREEQVIKQANEELLACCGSQE